MHWEYLQDFDQVRLYAGDVPNKDVYQGWIGISLTAEDDRHIQYDVTRPFPVQDESVDAFQSEDVFEHIHLHEIPAIVDEIYRVLKTGGLFRLSIPDYGCDILYNRTEKDASGNLIFDPGGGGTRENPGHVWFPKYEILKEALDQTQFKTHGEIRFLHHYKADGSTVLDPIDYSKGYVQRTPDHDPRVQNPRRPLSIVVDLIKKEHIAIPAKPDFSAPQITLFATPKPFKGRAAVVQENAIRSWAQLKPRPDIILLGDSPGTQEIAEELGLTYLPDVETNDLGTPLVRSLFRMAEAHSKAGWLAYLNCDVILMQDFIRALPVLDKGLKSHGIRKFFCSSQRIELNIQQPIDFNDPHWQTALRKQTEKEGVRDHIEAVEIAFFNKGLIDEIPDFAIGRPTWDTWMVWKAHDLGAAMIEATDAFLVLHQAHDYQHVKGGYQQAWHGEEAKQSAQLAGDNRMSMEQACTHVLTKTQLIPGKRKAEAVHQVLVAERIKRGFEAFNKKQYQSAIDFFDDAISRYGGFSPENVQFGRALSLVNLGRTREAVDALLIELNEWRNNQQAKNLLLALKQQEAAQKGLLGQTGYQGKTKPKFSFVMIALNSMPIIEYALRGIYDFAHEIIIVEGAVEKGKFAANEDGSSKDGTVETIQHFPDPDHKMTFIQGLWPEKVHMQNRALEEVTGDYVWLVDSDEVYLPETLKAISRMIEDDPSITQINLIPDNFWKGFDYIFISPEFFKTQAHYRRIFKMAPGAFFISHRPPTLLWPGQKDSTEEMHCIDGRAARDRGITFNHYSYVFDEQVLQKITLYKKYGWDELWKLDLDGWYRDFFQEWTPENRIELEKKYPIWTGDKNSRSERFEGKHPDVMLPLIERFNKEQAALSRKREEKQEDIVRRTFTEWETLALVGAQPYLEKVLDAWKSIELDEPLQKRQGIITKHTEAHTPFWNIHVALAFIATKLQPESYLEVGVRTGGSNVHVLNNCDVRSVTAMDMWSGNYAGYSNTIEYTKNQLKRFQEKTGNQAKIEFIHTDSHVGLKELIRQGRTYDLITIDGDHSEAGAWEDLKDAMALLNPGGAIVFDDIIHPEFLFLKGVAERLLKENPDLTMLINTSQDNGCVIFCRNLPVDDWFKEAGLKPKRQQPSKVRVASDHVETGMKVDTESDFAASIAKVFKEIKPTKIIETGTYLGRGTSTVIAETLKSLNLDATFFTIEVNPEYHQKAVSYFDEKGYKIRALHGLSVPRAKLPKESDIQKTVLEDLPDADIFVDHQEYDRVHKYFAETDFAWVEENLLHKAMKSVDFKPDFVLLDSAGHMGSIEFDYLLTLLKGPCIIALDDIHHIKHYRDYQRMLKDKRFEMITTSREKFGFCIARYTPKPVLTEKERERVLFMRTDSIGDAVLASAMLPEIRKTWPASKIAVVCQAHIAELYEHAPGIEIVITVPTELKWKDETEKSEFIEKVRAFNPTLLLNSVYSEHAISDIEGLEFVPRRFAFRQSSKANYTDIVPSETGWTSELEHHRDFLRGLDIQTSALSPQVFLSEEDKAFASDIFAEHHLDPQKTIALFIGARTAHRLYPPKKYAEVLKALKADLGCDFLLLGGPGDKAVHFELIKHLDAPIADLAGQATLRQSAAMIEQCRMYLGTETGAAHMACAVGTPNVVLLGGGHFGRFMPYSPLTSVISLPLDCYGCDWTCKYKKVHCIQDIMPGLIIEAVKQAWGIDSKKIRIFLPQSAAWPKEEGKPAWKRPDSFLEGQSFEWIPVASSQLQTGAESSAIPEAIGKWMAPFGSITLSRRSHFEQFKGLDEAFFEKSLTPDTTDLKAYQDLLALHFIRALIPKGGRILDIGGGDSRVLKYLRDEYECWNLDKLEGVGGGPKSADTKKIHLVRDYIGEFNQELPADYFDCIFSISAMEHVIENPAVFQRILEDMHRILKPGGYSFHLFDVVLKGRPARTNGFLPYLFEQVPSVNGFIPMEQLPLEKDLFVLPQGVYEDTWQAHTGKSYEEFGRPISYNILWQKPEGWSPRIAIQMRSGKEVETLPKITLVTPSFNQADFLERTIKSVLDQNYPNLEYIVMDGGSTDGSVEIIKKYADQLTFWQSQPDGGQYKGIQAGFEKSGGEIMGWLNADDMLHPDALFKLAYLFSVYPGIDWISGRNSQWDGEDKLIYVERGHMKPWCREDYLKGDFQWIQQESTFWRRDLWAQAGGSMDMELDLAGDLELWARFFRHASLYRVDELLGGYRLHGDQRGQLQKEAYLKEVDGIISRERTIFQNGADKTLTPAPEPIVPNASDFKAFLSRFTGQSPDEETDNLVLLKSATHDLKDYRITAIVSTYNAEAFIRDCLWDLEEQTVSNDLEIIVIDSHSEENERAIVEQFQKIYDNIVYVRTPERETIYQAWNRGVKLARGQYITNANTDDRHLSFAFEVQTKILDAFPNAGMVFADVWGTAEANEKPEIKKKDKYHLYAVPDFTLLNGLMGSNFGPHPMWRKSVHQSLGTFDPSYVVAGDYEFFYRVARKFGAVHIRTPLGLYYENQQGIEKSQPEKTKEEFHRLRQKLYQEISIGEFFPDIRNNASDPGAQAAAFWEMGNYCMAASLRPEFELAEAFYGKARSILGEVPQIMHNHAIAKIGCGKQQEGFQILRQTSTQLKESQTVLELWEIHKGKLSFEQLNLFIPQHPVLEKSRKGVGVDVNLS